MEGADTFVEQNQIEYDVTFISCLNLIVYGYSLLEKSDSYSRQQILNQTTKIRGRRAKKVELEDYLRHDLVTRFIAPNRAAFGLDCLFFQSGAEEFEGNIKKGILDIKVCSLKLDGTVYYIFECKRMHKGIEDNYVNEGIVRFIEGQYYPESLTTVAGMISFLEAEKPTRKIDCSSSFMTYTNLLNKHTATLQTKIPLKKFKLNCEYSCFVDGYEFVYVSSHGRNKGKSDIDLYHVILDYNHIVKP